MTQPEQLKNKSAVRGLGALLVAAAMALAGCQGQSILDAIFPEAEIKLAPVPPTPTNPVDEQGAQTPTPQEPLFVELVLWAPPQFDPNGESEGAALLNERLREFLILNPQVNLDIRIKAVSGPGSLIDSLTGANTVARDAVPSLVLLSRSDLVVAADRALLFPIEEMSASVDETDWYTFAQEMAIYQGSAYGLPFASNALGLIGKEGVLGGPQPSWDEALGRLRSLVFPAGDNDALITLALYQSAGGRIGAPMEQPLVDEEALMAVLDVYARAARSGAIKQNILEYQTDDQAWGGFTANESDAIITWANRLFSAPEGYQLALLPPLGENPSTLGTAWAWCLTETDLQKRQLAADLAEFLSDPEFLLRWAPLSGYLPVRPSSLPGYGDEELQSTLSMLLSSTHLRPDKQTAEPISAQLGAAVAEVISGIKQPAESAQDVLTRLEELDNQ